MPIRAPKTHLKDSAAMKTFKGVLITEEGCIPENNYLARNSPEELNTSGRDAAERLRKCKLVIWWLFATEFKIINSGAERKENKVKLFYLSNYYKWAP